MTEPKQHKEGIITGVVTEAYHHDKRHFIVIVRSSVNKSYFYFFTQRGSLITMGDQARLDFNKMEFYIIQDYFGYPFKKFRLELDPWPDTNFLQKLMAENPIFEEPK